MDIIFCLFWLFKTRLKIYLCNNWNCVNKYKNSKRKKWNNNPSLLEINILWTFLCAKLLSSGWVSWYWILFYSRWNRISDFSHFLYFWPLFCLKHLVWGSQFVTSKVTMSKLTFWRKFHWKMPYFWAFYHSKLRRKIIHFFIEHVSYFLR